MFYFPELRRIDQFLRPKPSNATPDNPPQIIGDSILKYNITTIARQETIQ